MLQWKHVTAVLHLNALIERKFMISFTIFFKPTNDIELDSYDIFVNDLKLGWLGI